MKINVLIAEDDNDLGSLLKQYLEINDFQVQLVHNGEKARAELKNAVYDILIIDVMMPREDGFALAEKLRLHYPQLPFLFVTARKLKEDILHGLKLGADDYIVKPFDADELILRMRNILKRGQPKMENLNEIYQIGIFQFDAKNLKLSSIASEKTLTEKEAQLLEYLYHHKGLLIKRNDILEVVWKEADFFNGRSMDVFITRLRKHLSGDPSIQIESIRGIGFRFKID
ncbi:DNA-binding response regulator, OmpR family, contains REC and winged-helix (wHTH) domain [Mucilaginibacter pineti]|uniref:DNA-binding response regulator, OmpR family, contains REC and winged-helix (WHTH) domain n=1 Tax=Mucilaginibacter pineti TaxID=1391627 RepID=A0A1G7H245_9SPHI|nr:response regulator transcription factor [Mucilaginibacter pineti]SDE94383.1 DNA-binding response regulator, OmpR family, contains REC and winged-helix (wHTH) domain [Mucilaginibacter pineti]